jgi:hypothetical protein
VIPKILTSTTVFIILIYMAQYYTYASDLKSVILQIGPSPGHLKESNQRRRGFQHSRKFAVVVLPLVEFPNKCVLECRFCIPEFFFFAEHRVDEEPWQSEIGFRSDAKTNFQLSPTFRLRGDFVKPKKYHAGAIVAFSGW